MSWADRLLGEASQITLTSPSGEVFTPLWTRSPVSGQKKIGEFDYPGFKGSVFQDLQTSALRYPLVLWFTGENNDIESRSFVRALNDEIGYWEVDNPAWGILTLQLLSFTAEASPVDSGNITRVTTEWGEISESILKQIGFNQPGNQKISGIPGITVSTAPSVSRTFAFESVQNQAVIANETISAQFENIILNGEKIELSENLVRKSAGLRAALDNEIAKMLTLIEKYIFPVAELSSDIFSQVKSIKTAVESSIQQAELVASQITGGISQIIQLPGIVTQIISQKIEFFKQLVENVIDQLPTIPDDENINVAAVHELTLNSTLVALSISVVNGEYQSRVDAFDAITELLSITETTVNALETIQTLYQDNPITAQYRAQTETYPDIKKSISDAVNYLIQLSESLDVEKTVRVGMDRTILQIASRYYGDISDDTLDLVINANALKGDRLLLLNPDDEVVVYI